MWPTAHDGFRNGFLERQVDAVRKLGIDCEVLVIHGSRLGPIGYAKAAAAVTRKVFSGEFDIVHAHYGLTGASCLFQRRPLVVTLHGSDFYGAVGVRGRRTLKGSLEAAISRVVARRADAVVAVSRRMAAHMAWAEPTVVPVGIDTDLFHPIDRDHARRALGLDCATPYVLFAANPHSPVKRHWLAKEAVSRLREDMPRARLVEVFGEPFDRMPLWMNAADALLITSVYEGGPMIHREAMACNLPVVSVDVGDVRAHLNGLRTSRVVPDDPRALASALREVIAKGVRSEDRAGAVPTDIVEAAEMLRDIYRRLDWCYRVRARESRAFAHRDVQTLPKTVAGMDKCTGDRRGGFDYRDRPRDGRDSQPRAHNLVAASKPVETTTSVRRTI
jgi:teichuronic acid biosynthesis glycosyltransferase TuaC